MAATRDWARYSGGPDAVSEHRRARSDETTLISIHASDPLGAVEADDIGYGFVADGDGVGRYTIDWDAAPWWRRTDSEIVEGRVRRRPGQ